MRVSAFFSAAVLIGAGIAQQTAPDSNVVIRSSTREVLLEVAVRDAHGRLVKKIEPGQVEVYENGVRQQIRSFRLVQGSEVRAEDEKQISAQTSGAIPVPGIHAPPPFNPLRTVNVVCLILNDLTPETRSFAFDAARKFVNNELRPDTFIGVFSLDSSGLRPVFPFSNNRERLLKAVELAAVNQLPTIAQSTASMLSGLTLSAAVLPIHAGEGAAADGSSVWDPLGTRGDIGVVVTAGLREIDALQKLVRQLSELPFQKTVMLMSSGLTRPPDQLEYWNALIKSANQAGVTFYGLDVYGLGVCQDSSTTDCLQATTPSAASVSLLKQSTRLSQGQSKIAVGAEGTTPRVPFGVNIGASQADQLMESMHQTDFVRFGVLSANTQEALRELSESTGGFLIANTNNTEKLLARVMEDVDTHYEISYRPTSEREDGHFRKIKVKLARPDLRVQTRGGYFAVPDRGGDPLTAADLAGLRALDTTPLPHGFEFDSRAFRFRSENGLTQYAIAFQVPIANLTATPEADQKKHKFHASLLALVKNAQGEIVDRISRDVPSDVSDAYVPALRSDFMTYEHSVMVPPGHYTVETAVVDQEGNRASTNILQIDSEDKPGLAVSDIALVHVMNSLHRAPDPSDPFEIPGKRASPFVSTNLPAGAGAYVYFVVYPDKKSDSDAELRAQFLMGSHVVASQKSQLPLPDASGAIPMAIHAVVAPGDYEVRITVKQGRRSVQRSLKYTIAMK